MVSPRSDVGWSSAWRGRASQSKGPVSCVACQKGIFFPFRDGSHVHPDGVWFARGSEQACRSELAAGREHHATTRLTRPNPCWLPRGSHQHQCSCRSQAHPVCATISTSFCRQRLRDRALLLRRLLCYVSSRQSSHPAFSSPPRATRHPRLSSRPRLLPLLSRATQLAPSLRRHRHRSGASRPLRRRLPSRQSGLRQAPYSPPPRATRHPRLSSRPRLQPLARQAAPSTPTLLARRRASP